MIITDKNDVESSVGTKGHDFGIDMDSMGILFKGFSDNLYSNKIGSIVREITSNCFDAHQEHGTQEDVVITMTEPDVFTNQAGKISFRDYGIGISPDRMEKIYSNYFSSTKRDSNGQIGGFGIGAKSPLSYTESFELFTVVDGLEYHYMVYRGEKVPRVDLLDTSATTEPRGSEVIIPIKTPGDFERFQTEIKNQLKYFDGLLCKNCGMDDDYTILKGNNFILREEGVDRDPDTMQLCIGKVAYPIDFAQMPYWYYGDYASDFALRFEIGDLKVTMNREAIEYTDGTVDLITAKMEAFQDEIRAIRLESIKEEGDLITYVHQVYSSGITLNGKKYALPSAPGFKTSVHKSDKWTFKPFEHFKWIKMTQKIMDPFIGLKGFVQEGLLSRKQEHTHVSPTQLMRGNMPVYRSKSAVTAKKIAYVSENIISHDYYIANMTKLERDEEIEGFYNNANKSFYDIEDEFYAEYAEYRKYILKYFISKTESFDRVEIDPEWDKEYKLRANSGYKKDNTVITIRTTRSAQSYHKVKTKISSLYKKYNKDSLIIYGYQGEEDEIRAAYGKVHGFIGNATNQNGTRGDAFNIFKISRANAKYMKGFTNAYHISMVPSNFSEKSHDLNAAVSAIQDLEYRSNIGQVVRNPLFQSMHGLSTLLILKHLSNYSASARRIDNGYKLDYLIDGEPIIRHIKSGIDVTRIAKQLSRYIDNNEQLINFINLDINRENPIFDIMVKTVQNNFKPFKYTL